MSKQNWGLAEIWNKSLEQREKRELKIREHIWASELGKAPVDVWLKMKATEETNPPNARSLRKFEAGNVFEWIVSLILKRAGILREKKKWVSYQYDGLLEVTGKSDFIVGGKPDLQKWLNEMSALNLPDVFLRAGKQILEYLAEQHPDGLEEKPLEIKSVSAFMYEALEKKKTSSKNHRLQLYHYLKASNYKQGNIIYICRDDLRMMEVPVFLNSFVEDEYRQAIETLTKYYKEDKQPPLEKAITFSEDLGKFAKNYNIAYSGYLTKLYGYKDQKEFDDEHTPIVARWNRVIGRIKQGKDMTAKNEEVKKEITDAGFLLDDILTKATSVEENN